MGVGDKEVKSLGFLLELLAFSCLVPEAYMWELVNVTVMEIKPKSIKTRNY